MKHLAFKIFARMLKSGQFHLLLSALVLATASITAINLFIDRIDNTLNNEASATIAADAKLQGSMPIPQEWFSTAATSGLKAASYNSFNAMVFSDQGLKLGRVKAVSDHYPLRGELEIRDNTTERRRLQSGPKPGEAWLAPVLFSALQVDIGDTIKIGNASFVITAELLIEPDSASTQFGIAPRALIHVNDVEKTGAIQLGSRVTYAMLVAGNNQQLTSFKTQIENELGEHYRFITPQNGNRAIGSALSRAQRFLLLSGSLSVVLAGLAIAMAAQRFSYKQQTQVALLKCLGLKPNEIQNIYLALLLSLGCLSIVVGLLLGWFLHQAIILLLGSLLPSELAAPGIAALTMGIVTNFVCLFAFAGPPIVALKTVTPMQIWKQPSSRFQALRTNILLGFIAVGLMLYFYSKNSVITAVLLASIAACVACSTVFNIGILTFTRRVQNRLHGIWRLGLANLQRQRALTGLQIFVFSTITLLMLVLLQVRTNLIETWKPQLENAPNHFVYNIFSDELDDFKSALQEAQLEPSAFYPMVRGRLVEINGQAIKERILEKSRNNYRRELNLTWSAELGSDNKIRQGQWWPEQKPDDQLLVSAEKEYAEGLGLQIGDQLRFSIAGTEIDARLASIRSVEWDSMNPNFYMIFSKPVSELFSANWVTSFYVDSDARNSINQLAARFPTVSIVDLDQTLAQIKAVATRVSMAVEFILVLVLLASLLVVLSSISSSMDERLKETALLRSFGAPRRLVQKIIVVEFSVIGLVAGLFACLGAEISLYFIQTRIFEMNYHFSYWMWLYAPIASTVIIVTSGYLATVATTHVSPIKALRERNAA